MKELPQDELILSKKLIVNFQEVLRKPFIVFCQNREYVLLLYPGWEVFLCGAALLIFISTRTWRRPAGTRTKAMSGGTLSPSGFLSCTFPRCSLDNLTNKQESDWQGRFQNIRIWNEWNQCQNAEGTLKFTVWLFLFNFREKLNTKQWPPMWKKLIKYLCRKHLMHLLNIQVNPNVSSSGILNIWSSSGWVAE